MILILGFMLLFSLILLLVVLTEMIVFVRTRVPFVPSPQKDIAELVRRLPITKRDVVYDLGSGNGKVVFAIEKLSDATVRGYQLAGWTQWYAKMRKTVSGSKAQFISGDFFKYHWGDATIVYAYLYPFLMRSVGDKALADCRPGTKIIARDFPIPNLRLHEHWDMRGKHEIFIYIV